MEEDQEESGLESGNEYTPGASSPEGPSADNDGRDSEAEETSDDEDDDSIEEKDDVSDGNSAEDNDDAEPGRTKKRGRRPKEFEVPTAWTWDRAENDRRVKEWKLEKAIDSNPTGIYPLRTQWMYEARLGDLSEEDYENKLRKEHKELLQVPPACRSAVGQMFLKRSKGDWEFRVVLTSLTWRYTKVKMKKEDAAAEGDRASVKAHTTEMTKTLNEGIESLFERFPDMHPAHERRQIEKKLGSNAVSAYVQALRTKVSSDAGRMQTAFLRNAGTLGMLESKSAGRKVLSIFDILGKKRKDVAFHLWGGSSSGGREECDKLITERMDDWKKEQVDRWKTLTSIETSRAISNEALKVVCDIRKELFEDLPTKTQAFWEEKAKHLHLPQTDEEKQCLVDAFLPALFRLLTHLSKHTSLHFVLLASGQGSSNVPVLAHEFSQSTDEQLSFMDDMPLTATTEEVVEGLPVMHTPDDSHTDVQNDPRPKQSKNPQRSRTPISPFQPNPSVVKSRSQRITYLSKWFMDAGERIVGYKITWDLFCKNVRKYVLTERMPMDPLVEGKTLEIQRPTAMEDPRFDAWWKFMVQSYDGTLTDEQCFMFRVEAVHQNIPAPPAPAEASAHQAAINASKTIPMKKVPAKGGPKKGRKAIKESAFAEADDFLDAAGIAEDEDAGMLEMA
ncbi:carbohydrate-binding module family 1 protein, partial [Tulasnella calospora MUT 4182]